MTGSIHKITAGCGYEYLTRQTAAMDATDKGHVTLADYYSSKGESPGRWMGSGLSGLAESASAAGDVVDDSLWSISAGDIVTAEHMKALFGEGRHPNATAIEEAMQSTGTAGDDVLSATKLGRRWSETSPSPMFRTLLAERLVAHNLAAGERWDAVVDDSVKAQLRTELGKELFEAEYARPAADDRELSGYIAQLNRPAPQGVAGYDLTFSPVKSVSTLWAIGYKLDRTVTVDGRSMDVSAAIEHAHRRAVADALAFVESHATFSRIGSQGIAQVDTEGLLATAFTHRDSRAGDPDLHTHVAVANKVRVIGADGRPQWVTLDGTPLYKAMVTASETYNSRLEMHVRDILGVRFVETPHADKAKRSVREIAGVPQSLNELWSKRRVRIEADLASLTKEFQKLHGREPTTTEALDLAQEATLASRDPKHEPRSLNEQRDAWWAEAVDAFGSSADARMIVGAALHTTPEMVRAGGLRDGEAELIARQIINTVAESRARWQRPHLRAEAERLLRQGGTLNSVYGNVDNDPLSTRRHLAWPGHLPADEVSTAIEQIADAAEQLSIRQHAGISDDDLNEPAILRRRDGASVYSTHDTHLFTSADILAAERRIIAAAHRVDGRTVDDIHVDLALLEEAAHHRALNTGQTAMVRALATSGRRVQLVLAPAGTGKTTAMRAFGTAWTDSGGHVLGLAPTAAAAAVLREDLGTQTETLAKLVHCVQQQQKYDDLIRLAKTNALKLVGNPQLRARVDSAKQMLDSGKTRQPVLPDWFSRIGKDSVLLVDEAGMASTADLDVLVRFAMTREACVRLVGDDQQLASISAGGVLRDVAHETGALTLSHVVRFSDTAEGAASLGLRDGDRAALGFLADEHRIHVAPDVVAADQAYEAWADDRYHGHDSVMLAATRDTTNHLNERARADRILDTVVGREVALADGLSASVGDIICTRRNDRTLRTSTTDWVRNGDRWEVIAVTDQGGLSVRHVDRGRTLNLPPKYVSDHVTLGYASTIHAAQGMTADYCHVVGSDSLTRQLLYVAMTRGRHGNHIYLSTAEDDPHKIITPKALSPQTAIDILGAVLDRDEAQRSATTSEREGLDPFRRIARQALAYDDAIGTLAEHQLGVTRLNEIDAAANELHPRLTDEGAWPVLRKHLATLEVDGKDAVESLSSAYSSREVTTAQDVAAVLDWRLDPTGEHSAHRGGAPLPWLPAIPRKLTDPAHSAYLSRRGELVDELATAIRSSAAGWTVRDCPQWARPYLANGADIALVADLAVFRAAMDVADSDARPTGAPHPAAAIAKAQKQLERRAGEHVRTSDDARRWHDLVYPIDRHIVADPHWPVLAEELSALKRGGVDIDALVAEHTEAPLPSELPAAALWWRISRTVDPATVETTDSGLRPDWINVVADVLDVETAEVVIACPAWPAFVAAMTAAHDAGWDYHHILDVAATSVYAAAEDVGDPVRRDELARNLSRHIDVLLTHEAHIPDVAATEEPLSPDAEEMVAHLDDESDADRPEKESTTIDHPAAVDDAYLSSLSATEPPLDDYELIPEPENLDDHWDDLRFTDFSQSAPITIAEDSASSTAEELIVDYYEYVQRRKELIASIDELSDAMSWRRGPRQMVLSPQIIQMRRAADRQLPAAGDVAALEADLRAARSAAAPVLVERDQLQTHMVALQRAIDDGTAVDDPDRRLDPDYQSPAEQLLELRAAHSIVAQRSAGLSAVVDTVDRQLSDAEDRLADVVAETGGQRVTSSAVDHMWLTATDLDNEDLEDLRYQRKEAERRLFRIENSLAHRHSLAAVKLPVTTTAREGAISPGRVAYDLGAAQSAASHLARAAELGSDPVRVVSDRELASTIAAVRRRITRIQGDMTTSVPAARTLTAEHVQRDHDRINVQIDHINAARRAAAEVDRAAAVVQRAQQDLDDHQQITPRRRGRTEHATRADQLASTLQRAKSAHRELEATADRHGQTVGAPPPQWDTILASADPTRRRNELATARSEDSARRDRAAADADDLATAQTKLDRALREVARRDALTPEDRHREDLARTEIAAASAPDPTPNADPAVAVTGVPPVDHGYHPQTEPDLGYEM